MFMYGILSVLYVLEYFEFDENYEEYQKIIDAIKEQEQILDTRLFSTITTETIKEVVESYKIAQSKVLFKDIFVNRNPIDVKAYRGIRVYNVYEGSNFNKWFSEVFEKKGNPIWKKTIEDLLIYDIDLAVSF